MPVAVQSTKGRQASSRLPSISERSPHTAGAAELPVEAHQQPATARLPVIDCISACVEADVRAAYSFSDLIVYRQLSFWSCCCQRALQRRLICYTVSAGSSRAL